MQRRIQALAVVLTLCFLAILIQLVNIQFVRAPALDAAPDNPRNVAKLLNMSRGNIIAGNGAILAASVPSAHSIFKYQRTYPMGSLFSHLVGVSSIIYGNYGLEEQYNSYLSPHTLAPTTFADLFKTRTGTDTVITSLQPSLQQLARNQLADRDGAVVVLNPTTGEVLAMYANPSYGPNSLVAPSTKVERAGWLAATTKDANGFQPLASLAYQNSFPPGSTFKTVTSAAAYDLKPDLANKYYPFTSTISLPDSNKTLSNFGYGTCGGTLAMMLPPSCDTGFAEMGLDLGGLALSTQARAFGFSLPSPIDLPGAIQSSFPSAAEFKHNQPGLAYSAIGQQNVRATALQNAMVAAGIANGGIVMLPHVATAIRDPNGQIIKTFPPRQWRIAMSKAAVSQLIPLMQQVVTNGTAYGVFNPANDVAAKTGTAQTGNAVNNTDDWMIAFAPASAPKVAIAVVLPNQSVSATGAQVAGPVANCMIEGALAFFNHQPVSGTATTCPS